MGRGILNIVMGGIAIFGGATGTMVVRGTSSSWGLVVIGVIFVLLGIARINAAR